MQASGRQSSYLYYYGFTAQRLGKLSLLDQTFLNKVVALSIKLSSASKTLLLSTWLEDILKIIRLQKTFAGLATNSETANFVRSLLHAGGVGATPNLRDTYLALRILAELDNLTGLDETKTFIKRLQLPAFGFQYTESAVSDPDIDTFYAGVFSCLLLEIESQGEISCLPYCHHSVCMEVLLAHLTAWEI